MCFRILAPFFRKARDSGKYPWVIGGHRGRIYEDNSGALHSYIFKHTKQPIIWIANSPMLLKESCAQGRGCAILKRNSFAARLAILRAPVLIYSHGEDDLDLFLLFFRKALGMRVFLGHSLKFLKTGQYTRLGFGKWTWPKRKLYAFLMTDFDLFPMSSPAEKKHGDAAFRYRTERILPYGGGAHIDRMLALREEQPANIITWFPTFRDKKAEQNNAYKVINNILNSARLHEYLEKEDLRLAVAGHINSKNMQSEISNLHPRISIHSAKEAIPLLGSSVCFISDYSGLISNWLCFGRPLILFPFDKEEYLKSRSLCVSLEDIHYGPLVYTAEDFLEALCSGTWKDMKPYAEKRKHWMNEIFPDLRPGYSERCYEAIRKFPIFKT
ncbi:MAG: CDP-glycerol glycerophosphotransferase family protein [Fibromonadaceae bacterium]|nr:CDP-glycerol glycerophosphotransferase family protein [Fibromonadaceae bacterium]